ncbi:hypothetical protein SH2C18_09470 [Clostridium sediminicola]|uniref:NifU family protein n=1 Tax=Clostridium sediminicola TaxID=3114879 RepID=UPI0031F26E7C
MEEKILRVIDEQIRPILAGHGGDIKLVSFTDNKVVVKLLGNCSSCYAADETFRNHIQNVILEEVEGVKEVILDRSIDEELLNIARDILRKKKGK